ncbi:MAG: hypothetical protein AB2651_19205 [Candidatus Thiodiazotropha sp.]
MKTHELAKALNILAKALKSGPNIELKEINIVSLHELSNPNDKEIAFGLSTLAEMSRIDKKQWVNFINENRFPIDIRPRDASRDLLGKLLKYLETNEFARKSLKEKANIESSTGSAALLKAFEVLLNK